MLGVFILAGDLSETSLKLEKPSVSKPGHRPGNPKF